MLITGADKGVISLFEICREDKSLEMKKGDFFLQDVRFDGGFFLDSMDFFNEERSLLVHSANRVSREWSDKKGNWCNNYAALRSTSMRTI